MNESKKTSQMTFAKLLGLEAILYTEGNIPMIEYRSRWHGHDDLLTKDILETTLADYHKNNPDEGDPYMVFMNSDPGWRVISAKLFKENYSYDPNNKAKIKDEFVAIDYL